MNQGGGDFSHNSKKRLDISKSAMQIRHPVIAHNNSLFYANGFWNKVTKFVNKIKPLCENIPLKTRKSIKSLKLKPRRLLVKKNKNKNYFFNFLDYFIPQNNIHIYAKHDLFKARAIISAGIIGEIMIVYYLATQNQFPSGYLACFITLIGVGFLCITGLKLFNLSLMNLSIIVSLLFWAVLNAFLIIQQNYFNGVTNWFIPCILVSYFIVGTKWAGLLTFLTVISFISNYYLTRDAGLTLSKDWELNFWSINLLTDQVSAVIFGYIVMFFYNSSRLRVEKDLKNSQIKITAQQESMYKSSRLAELGEVAAGIAHEINNPLTVIQGHTQLLLKKVKNNQLATDAIEKSLLKIEETCSRITKIINNLNSFSRDGDNEPFEVLPVCEIMQEMQTLFLEKFKKNQIDFKVDSSVKQRVILAKKVQIFQVLINLINNAADAMAEIENKWIEIKIMQNNTETKIMVIDAGPGIDEAIADKVLLPFFTTKPFGKGTGLGLSISNNILLQHKGRIQIEKVNGQSCIILVFPNSKDQTISANKTA